MTLNLWRVAAYILTTLAFGGTFLALIMDTEAVSWAALFTSGVVWTRVEWVLAAMAASTTKGDSSYEP
jgi:hypothetical protein